MWHESDHSIVGVILAGEHAWGASELERLLPRPLLPVADSPLIAYSLRAMRDSGITDITVCANSDTRSVRQALQDGASLGLKLSYYEDQAPRGPGGCVRDAAWGAGGDYIVVAESSVIPMFRLGPVLKTHIASGAAVTVAVQEERDRVHGSLSPAGVYVFSRAVLAGISATGYQDIKERLVPRLNAVGERVALHRVATRVPRVTSIKSYLAANEWVVGHFLQKETSLPGYRRQGSALIHETAEVAERAQLIGPVLIGPYTTIDDDVMLTGPVVIGAAVEIEPQSLISQTVVWDGCRVGYAAEIDGCVLAGGADVGAGRRLTDAVVSTAMGSRTSARAPARIPVGHFPVAARRDRAPMAARLVMSS